MMSNEVYEASVAIWHGMKPVANGGWVAIADGQVRLWDGKGQLLAEGPTHETWAKAKGLTMGSGLSAWIGGEKFMLSPGSGNRPSRIVVSANNPGLGVGASVVSHGRDWCKEFLAALEAAGGHKGKPA